MANEPNRRPKRLKRGIEDQLEDLELYAEFQAKIIPELRKLILDGASARDILTKYTPQVAARLVQAALMEPDNVKALSAIKDLLDRVHGKATEKKEIKHQFDSLTDEQLDALLKTELTDMESLDGNEDLQ